MFHRAEFSRDALAPEVFIVLMSGLAMTASLPAELSLTRTTLSFTPSASGGMTSHHAEELPSTLPVFSAVSESV